MEGVLWKWTNYWSGWQPRWFVLDNGVLAYYKSQEEVNQGCKGSIKMSVCEIIVNSADSTRLDLVIPSEQHFYLKAATPQERQQWLVALGSSKASRSARPKKDSTSASPDMLKTKKSELRLYCDLLMQQVHTVKSASTEKSPPDLETLTEATSLLGATCDTFIRTLEECMKLANANFPYELPHQLITDSALPPSVAPTNALKKTIKSQVNRSTSVDRPSVPDVHHKSGRLQAAEAEYQQLMYASSSSIDSEEMSPENLLRIAQMSFDDGPSSSGTEHRRLSTASSEESAEEEVWAEISDNENNNQDSKTEAEAIEEETNSGPKIDTFFSNLKISFLNLKIIGEDEGIPTKHFLDSCAIVITIFEMFGSPIFAPMKIDVMGNLKKITEKYKLNPERYCVLQDIVRYEMETNTTSARNSATDALMWLKRGLEFVYEFLLEFSKGNPDLLKNCALNAYNRTLKQYHGWIVRGIISAATHTVPSRQEVLSKLALKPRDVLNPLYEEQIKDDARRFIKAMDKIIKILNRFYLHHNLDKSYLV